MIIHVMNEEISYSFVVQTKFIKLYKKLPVGLSIFFFYSFWWPLYQKNVVWVNPIKSELS